MDPGTCARTDGKSEGGKLGCEGVGAFEGELDQHYRGTIGTEIEVWEGGRAVEVEVRGPKRCISGQNTLVGISGQNILENRTCSVEGWRDMLCLLQRERT